jgi:peptide/nickel transport system permease protein
MTVLNGTEPVEPIPAPPAPTTGPVRRGLGWLGRMWQRERGPSVWGVILLGSVLASVLGPLFAQPSSFVNPVVRLQSPSAAHWFGTDELGRDILSRMLTAGGVSLGLGALVTIISLIVGGALGLAAGYYRGLDGPIMRVMDAMLAFPPLVLATALVVFLGDGERPEVIALSIVFTPYLARVARSSAISVRERTFITAARSSGLTGTKILLRHILPNATPAILVQLSFIYAFTLLSDAALSFLGLGVSSPTPTWGNMVAEGRPYISSDPTFVILPGLAIVIVVMALNFIGDGVRNLVDPRTRAVLDMRRRRPAAAASKPPVAAEEGLVNQ